MAEDRSPPDYSLNKSDLFSRRTGSIYDSCLLILLGVAKQFYFKSLEGAYC
jgi:hypothetical protein